MLRLSSHLARLLVCITLSCSSLMPATLRSQESKGDIKVYIPRKQTQPPGPPLSPAEAIKKMQVPEGFHVELVASEPDLLNPVAMAFDERGRIWVTESFEYPRHEPGPAKTASRFLKTPTVTAKSTR